MRQTASYACVCCVAHTQRRVHFATDRLLVYTRSISIWRSCADLTGIASTTLLLLFFLHTIALILKRRFRYVKKLFWYNCNHTLCLKIDISLSRGGKLRHNSLTAMNRPVFLVFFFSYPRAQRISTCWLTRTLTILLLRYTREWSLLMLQSNCDLNYSSKSIIHVHIASMKKTKSLLLLLLKSLLSVSKTKSWRDDI